MVENPLELTKTYRILRGDRLYDAMLNFTVLFSALGIASSALANGSILKQERSAARFRPIRFHSGIALPVRGPLEIALQGKTPDFIEIGLTSLEHAATELEGAVVRASGFNRFTLSLAKPVFLLFFERYNVWLTDTLGDGINWPMTLNFARVVRNAIAHGSINIRNPGTAPVQWMGLSYGYPERGRDIFAGDLGATDLLGLMLECDEELDKLGAPVL